MPSKKSSRKKIEELALAYEIVHIKEKENSEIKQALKAQIDKLLEFLELDFIEVDVKATKPLRVRKVTRRTISYNTHTLKKLLSSKGKKALRTGFKLVVDNKGLENLYSEGIVQYEELQKCAEKIKEKDMITVLRVRRNLKE